MSGLRIMPSSGVDFKYRTIRFAACYRVEILEQANQIAQKFACGSTIGGRTKICPIRHSSGCAASGKQHRHACPTRFCFENDQFRPFRLRSNRSRRDNPTIGTKSLPTTFCCIIWIRSTSFWVLSQQRYFYPKYATE